MDKMYRWERILILFFILVLVVILLAVSSRLMEDRMDLEVGVRYSLLLGYFAFGIWLALRIGKQHDMAEKVATKELLAYAVWIAGLFVVFFVVTPW